MHKNLTASGVIFADKCFPAGFVLTAGADTATAVLYDNASAGTGTILAKLSAVANTSAFADLSSASAQNGIYATLTGTTPSVTVVLK